jgi:hypothetical protein
VDIEPTESLLDLAKLSFVQGAIVQLHSSDTRDADIMLAFKTVPLPRRSL